MHIDAVMWPDRRWRDAVGEWTLAEGLGIHRGWVYDHLTLGPDRTLWHEAMTHLAAVAAATTTMGIGTMVTTPNFRDPAPTAKALLTIQDVSEGRLVAGIGAGGPGSDSDARGGDPLSRADRMARLDEWAHQVRDLLTTDHLDSDGRWSTVRDTRLGGSPEQAPPIAVAGTGPKGMRLAVDIADIWITQDIAQDARLAASTAESEISRQLDLLDRECETAGRDPRSLARLAVLGYGSERPLASRAAFEDAVERYGRLGITTIAVLWPRDQHELAVLADVLSDAGPVHP